MCHRITPLLFAEAQQAIADLHETGRARVPKRQPNTEVPDAYPGKQVPLFVPDESGELQPALLTWGFDAIVGGSPKLVFNTRIETALSQLSSGRGLWTQAMASGRCLVPVRSFYESFTKSPTREGRRRDVRFAMPGRPTFLLAGVRQGDRFSIVTTTPNADVSPIHTRMPLVLAPGESSIWLHGDFASLADRTAVRLTRDEELVREG